MSFGFRNILIRHGKRCWRPFATLVVLPALVLSSSSSHAILIHDHHGHDTHGHAVTLGNLGDIREHSDHHHEEHDHDGASVDPAEDEGLPLLVVLDIPEMLSGSRTSSNGSAVATGIGAALRTIAIDGCVVEGGRSPVGGPLTLVGIPRARSWVASVLATNHALLL